MRQDDRLEARSACLWGDCRQLRRPSIGGSYDVAAKPWITTAADCMLVGAEGEVPPPKPLTPPEAALGKDGGPVSQPGSYALKGELSFEAQQKSKTEKAVYEQLDAGTQACLQALPPLVRSEVLTRGIKLPLTIEKLEAQIKKNLTEMVTELVGDLALDKLPTTTGIDELVRLYESASAIGGKTPEEAKKIRQALFKDVKPSDGVDAILRKVDVNLKEAMRFGVGSGTYTKLTRMDLPTRLTVATHGFSLNPKTGTLFAPGVKSEKGLIYENLYNHTLALVPPDCRDWFVKTMPDPAAVKAGNPKADIDDSAEIYQTFKTLQKLPPLLQKAVLEKLPQDKALKPNQFNAAMVKALESVITEQVKKRAGDQVPVKFQNFPGKPHWRPSELGAVLVTLQRLPDAILKNATQADRSPPKGLTLTRLEKGSDLNRVGHSHGGACCGGLFSQYYDSSLPAAFNPATGELAYFNPPYDKDNPEGLKVLAGSIFGQAYAFHHQKGVPPKGEAVRELQKWVQGHFESQQAIVSNKVQMGLYEEADYFAARDLPANASPKAKQLYEEAKRLDQSDIMADYPKRGRHWAAKVMAVYAEGRSPQDQAFAAYLGRYVTGAMTEEEFKKGFSITLDKRPAVPSEDVLLRQWVSTYLPGGGSEESMKAFAKANKGSVIRVEKPSQDGTCTVVTYHLKPGITYPLELKFPTPKGCDLELMMFSRLAAWQAENPALTKELYGEGNDASKRFFGENPGLGPDLDMMAYFPVDGVYGTRTEEAVGLMQQDLMAQAKALGIPADLGNEYIPADPDKPTSRPVGIFGPKTAELARRVALGNTSAGEVKDPIERSIRLLTHEFGHGTTSDDHRSTMETYMWVSGWAYASADDRKVKLEVNQADHALSTMTTGLRGKSAYVKRQSYLENQSLFVEGVTIDNLKGATVSATGYGHVDPNEGFADDFALYINDPSALLKRNTAAFLFFAAQYPHPTLGDTKAVDAWIISEAKKNPALGSQIKSALLLIGGYGDGVTETQFPPDVKRIGEIFTKHADLLQKFPINQEEAISWDSSQMDHFEAYDNLLQHGKRGDIKFFAPLTVASRMMKVEGKSWEDPAVQKQVQAFTDWLESETTGGSDWFKALEPKYQEFMVANASNFLVLGLMMENKPTTEAAFDKMVAGIPPECRPNDKDLAVLKDWALSGCLYGPNFALNLTTLLPGIMAERGLRKCPKA